MDEVIDVFRGQYGFLSNFYDAQVVYNGSVYKSAEAAYQAAKCSRQEEQAPFTNYSAREAKYYGNMIKKRSDWNCVRNGIMEDIVRAKFEQNTVLADKLIATKDAEIIEGNTWGDIYWGVDLRKNKGENHLGKILMKIRRELTDPN